jgi:hypothetical protein
VAAVGGDAADVGMGGWAAAACGFGVCFLALWASGVGEPALGGDVSLRDRHAGALFWCLGLWWRVACGGCAAVATGRAWWGCWGVVMLGGPHFGVTQSVQPTSQAGGLSSNDDDIETS